MPEITRLTEFLRCIQAEKIQLDNYDVDACVTARLESMRPQITEEIKGEIEHKKLVADVKISTIESVIDLLTPADVDAQEETATFADDETY